MSRHHPIIWATTLVIRYIRYIEFWDPSGPGPIPNMNYIGFNIDNKNGPGPKWARGPSGPRAQVGQGPSGPGPKWAQGPSGPGPKCAQGPSGPGPKSGPKWARAQVGPGPKWAQGPSGPGPKSSHPCGMISGPGRENHPSLCKGMLGTNSIYFLFLLCPGPNGPNGCVGWEHCSGGSGAWNMFRTRPCSEHVPNILEGNGMFRTSLPM